MYFDKSAVTVCDCCMVKMVLFTLQIQTNIGQRLEQTEQMRLLLHAICVSALCWLVVHTSKVSLQWVVDSRFQPAV